MNTITARNFMSKSPISLSPEMDVMDAMESLTRHRISGAPVVDDRGHLVGILTERDCIQTFVHTAYHGQGKAGMVAEYMSDDVQTVDVNASLLDIAQRFASSKYRRYPVMEEGRLVGIISRRDVISAVLKFA
jgi:CBS domain-containing protein